MSRIAVLTLAALAAPAVGLAVAAGGPVSALAASASPGVQSLAAAAPAATPSPTAKASPKPTSSVSKPSPTSISTPQPAPPPPSTVPTPVPVTTPLPPTACQNAPQQPYEPSSSTVSTTPWAQNVLNFTSVWPLTTGAKVTVAVVDSGVDYSTQFGNRVNAIDMIPDDPAGIEDCVGHGTMVAGIIAAADDQPEGNPFAGVAPDANILSVKVTNSEDLTNQLTADPATIADAIIDAVNLHASVINVSIASTSDDPQMEYALSFALSHNVVVVAAAGNDEPNPNDPAQIITGPFWPASYPGVLSVGAVEQGGSLASFSDTRTPVDVTAPGVEVTSIVPGGYYVYNGTSFAAPFVAGVAALIRSEYPSMTAAQVVARIEETADGGTGPGTGYGLVNPVAAVTAALPSSTSANPSLPPRPGPVSVARPEALNRGTRDAAMAVTGGSVSAAALLAVGALVITQGRRRRWRAGAGKEEAAKTPPDDAVPEDASFW
jgi:membrane-anchored mycosin MYCP